MALLADRPMTLRQKQSLFSFFVAGLILHADTLGFEVTFGETWRSPEEAARLAKLHKGTPRSLHCDRLAIDLNLFKNGRYLTSSEAYRPLGDFWKTLHPLCRWGGDFKPRADGNHFSMTHGGRQ